MILFCLMELICLLILFYYLGYYLLNIYQQEHYDFYKLSKSLPTYYFKKIYTDFLYIYLILILFNNIYHTIIILIMTIFILVKPNKYIIKLKFTSRIIRLIMTMHILMLIPFLFITTAQLLLFIIELFFLPFIMYIANLLNYPVEGIIKKVYLEKAKKKFNKNKDLIKIAITGSYGKTSTKNILNHLLKKSYISLATPKSYNTLMGITKTINEGLNSTTEILIMEMGAFKKGEIKKMVKEFPPNISVITEVGPQHLSTFKSIEGVLNAKLEIASNQPYESALVLNIGNEYLSKVDIINIKDIYKVGANQNSDYWITNIKTQNGKTQFTIETKDERHIEIESPLLGKHNASNILICYGIVQALKNYKIEITDEEFCSLVKSLPQIDHRLEYKKNQNYHIYDDSYNSNVAGFTSAIELFHDLDTKKIIITPGIVDGGKYAKNLNETIAKKLIGQFDDIYLVKNEVITYYIDIFKQNQQPYKIFNSFKDAFNAFKNKYTEEVSLLIENDLPDNFLER